MGLGHSRTGSANVSATRPEHWVPASSMRLARRVRFGVGELTSYLDAGIGGTHQWFVEDNRHQVVPTMHVRSGVGTTALRYEMGWNGTVPIWSMTLEVNVPGVIQVLIKRRLERRCAIQMNLLAISRSGRVVSVARGNTSRMDIFEFDRNHS